MPITYSSPWPKSRQVLHKVLTDKGAKESMDVDALIADALHERKPQKPVFQRAVTGLRPRKLRRFTRYSEDTFVKANVDPGLDIPQHHQLLTKYGFQYLDAMPMNLEKGNTDFIHSYLHEKDAQIIVSSNGAWNLHIAHDQEESAVPGPGTWLTLEPVLKRQFRMVEGENLQENLSPGGGFGAIYNYYYSRPQYDEQHAEDTQEIVPRQPTPVEQTIDSVLAGLSTHEAIHNLVHTGG